MKPKNIMLLGFVNKAVDYLEKHMDEEPDARLAELKRIDLASIKDELTDYLDSSLGTMQSTMSTLLKAGNEAFDQFIEVNHKENVSDQLNRMFDVDFNDDKKTNQEELAKLLSFYNLEDFDTEIVEEIDIPKIEKIDIPQFDDNNFESEDDEFLQEIKKNITNDDIQDVLHVDDGEIDPAIDSIFTEIVENESKPSKAIVKDENVKIDVPELKEEKIEPIDAPELKEKKIEPIDAPELKEEKVEPISDSEQYNRMPIENPAIDKVPIDEVANDDTTDEEQETYVNSLIDELREQMIKEDEARKEAIKKDNEVYESVHQVYANLSREFVKSAYALKESIAEEYPTNKKIIILHRILFDDVENLRKFVEIGLNHNYTINADEKKLIVDILKEFVNSDGKILSNIFEIANQASVLNGQYEGYNIIINE